MLTYDSKFDEVNSLDELMGEFPDLIETGETNLYWISMRRSTKKMELTSKVTGVFFASFTLEDAPSFGISVLQIGAGRVVLELKRPVV